MSEAVLLCYAAFPLLVGAVCLGDEWVEPALRGLLLGPLSNGPALRYVAGFVETPYVASLVGGGLALGLLLVAAGVMRGGDGSPVSLRALLLRKLPVADRSRPSGAAPGRPRTRLGSPSWVPCASWG